MENKKIRRVPLNKKNLRKLKIKKRRKQRLIQRRLGIILAFLVTLGACVWGIALITSKVFCVKEITVEGNTLYEDREILSTIDINLGDSLMFLDTNKSEKKLYENFKYIDDSKIYKEFPDKLKIVLEMASPKTAVYKDDGFYIISEKSKLLDVVTELPSEVIEIKGLDFEVQDNTKIVYTNPEQQKVAQQIISEFSSAELNSIKSIDLTALDNICVNYDGRIDIILGNSDDMHYKIITTREIITHKLNQYEKGVLDLRKLPNNNKTYYTPATN